MVTNVKEGNPPRRLAWVLGALVFAAMFSIFSVESEAGTHWVGSCGAILSGDETYVLVEDLECEVFPAITVVGPAKLQLNGYTVSCALDDLDEVAADSIGILVEGHDGDVLGTPKTAPRLTANTVTSCETGVVVNGEGKHRIQGVTVTRSTDAAFLIESDENKIVGNIIRQSRIWNGLAPLTELFPVEGSGFVVEGDENLLVANSAADVEGDYEGPEPDGAYRIHGNWNVLQGNLANDNEAYGFLVAGSYNTLDANSALKNITHGFFIAAGATKNELKHNKGFENGDEPKDGDAASGFYVEGSGNDLEDNIALRNGFYGIHLAEGAIGNSVSSNKAFDNLGWDEVEPVGNEIIGGSRIDLLDENECGANKWTLNVFGVRSQACIK